MHKILYVVVTSRRVDVAMLGRHDVGTPRRWDVTTLGRRDVGTSRLREVGTSRLWDSRRSSHLYALPPSAPKCFQKLPFSPAFTPIAQIRYRATKNTYLNISATHHLSLKIENFQQIFNVGTSDSTHDIENYDVATSPRHQHLEQHF